jgi:hypothetical protein
MALVKYNNNSISAITDVDSSMKGTMTLIKEQTASSSSTISFVDGTSDVVLDSTYPIYLFKFINLHPATDDVIFHFQGNASGGSGYNETITSTIYNAYNREDDGGTVFGYMPTLDQAQGTSYHTFAEGLGNDNDHSLTGTLHIFNPSSTTFVKHFITRTQYTHASDRAYSMFTAGYFNTTSAIDEIQFKMSSGNIDSGTIKLYGIKDS